MSRSCGQISKGARGGGPAQQLCSQLASATGPLIVGTLYTQYGSYPAALRWLVLLSVAGALLLARVQPPGDHSEERPLAH